MFTSPVIIGISDLPSSLEFGTFIPFASINVGSKSIASTKSLEFVPLVLSALFLGSTIINGIFTETS